MFDHIQLKVKDLNLSKRFYTAALAPLGFTMEYEGDGLIGFGPKGAPALWLGEGRVARACAYRFRGQGPRRGEGVLCCRSTCWRPGQWQAWPPARLRL
jgi:catechol 2,3-dioxygenase-like lactoylglutathione lyase family enzyme